jgi:predicted GTPase
MQKPNFVITGAPNKGKSSVVAALTGDERIEIKERAGTTRENQEYPMQVDNEMMYTLWDTPGFENSRGLREALEKTGIKDAANKIERYKNFCEYYEGTDEFKNEVEILRPILPGAVIVYVVDSSVPYSDSQYLNEIKVLKWTGMPVIAILNPINGREGIEQWRAALSNHFDKIEVFNPHTATFKERLRLLDTFSKLNPDWTTQVQKAIQYLQEDRERILEACSEIMMSAVLEMYSQDIQINYDDIKTEEVNKERLLAKFKKEFKKTLSKAEDEICSLFSPAKEHINMNYELHKDVLSKNAFKEYLSPYLMASIGAVAGGTAGLTLDLVFGGLTSGLPTLFSAVGGGALGFFKNIDVTDLIMTGKTGRKYELKKIEPYIAYLMINRLRELVVKRNNKSAANKKTISIDYDFGQKETYDLSKLIKKVIDQGNSEMYKEKTKRELKDIILKKLKEDQKEFVKN